jgi:hypothetical protein
MDIQYILINLFFQYLGDPNIVEAWANEMEPHIFSKSQVNPQNQRSMGLEQKWKRKIWKPSK